MKWTGIVPQVVINVLTGMLRFTPTAAMNIIMWPSLFGHKVLIVAVV